MSPAVADLATLLENASLKILVKILPLLKYTVVQTSPGMMINGAEEFVSFFTIQG